MSSYPSITAKLTLGLMLTLATFGIPFSVSAQEADDIPPAEGEKADQPKAKIEPVTNPIVKELLSKKPVTAKEIFRTMSLLVDLSRADIAEQYAKQFMAMQVEDATLAEISENYGASLFRIAAAKELQGLGIKISQRVLDGANRHYSNPARLTGLIEKLSSDDAVQRGRALIELRKSQKQGPIAMIQALADENKKDDHLAIQNGIVALGKISIGPLLGAMDSNDANLKTQALSCLNRLKANESLMPALGLSVDMKVDAKLRDAAKKMVLTLIGKAPSREAVVNVLKKRAYQYLDGKIRLDTKSNDEVIVWLWNGQLKKPFVSSLPHDVALSLKAAQFATDLYLIAPDSGEHRRLFLTSRLQAIKMSAGMHPLLKSSDPAFYQIATKLGAAACNDVLSYSIKKGYDGAAVAAAELLGDIGKVDLIQSQKNSTAPLIQAVRHSNRHIRFAALASIMKLNPQKAYTGSSHVAAALGYFSSSIGVPRAVIADTRASKAQSIGGLLIALGYDVEIATSGRACIKLATSSPDYEFTLVDIAISDPVAARLIQQLRHDLRTANLPIGLLAPPKRIALAKKIATIDPLVIAMHHAQDTSTMKYQVYLLMKRAGRLHLTSKQRLTQAKQSLQWMAKLITPKSNTRKMYDLRRHQIAVLQALQVPELSNDAIGVLALLGSKEAQRALVDYASSPNRTLTARTTAYNAWLKNIEQHGLSLTRKEVLLQYERYKASERLDVETQQLLGRILDTLEVEQGFKKPVSATKPKDGKNVNLEK